MWQTLYFMGGYEAYVWSCYGMTLVALLGLVWRGWCKKKRVMQMLNQHRQKY